MATETGEMGTVTSSRTPLVGPAPAEVPLERAPLVHVVCQLRFPLIASISKRDFIAPFQEAIRPEYSQLRPQQSRSIVLGPDGVVNERSHNVWRFVEEAGDWKVTLAADFLALETSKYTSRDDFLARLERVLGALREFVNPRTIDRLGVRYIDRVSGADLSELSLLVRPEVIGIMGSTLSSMAIQSITQNFFNLPESGGQLMARWGLIPPKRTVDPGAVPPVDEPSWLLDLDAFIAGTQQLDVSSAVAQARAFAKRVYSFFRWAVTDAFLEKFGGMP